MLVYNEEERMLADSAEEFIQDLSPISAQRALRDEHVSLGFSADTWGEMINMGWPAMPFAEQYGGLDYSCKGLTAIFEQIGVNLCAAPMLSSVILAGCTIERCALDAHKEHYLPSIIDGQLRLALAFDEGRLHAPERIASDYVKTANGYQLSGHKTMVIDGIDADAYLIVAKHCDNDNDFAVFYVPADTLGLTVTKLNLIDSRNYAQLIFDGIELPDSAKISGEDFDILQLQQTLDIGRCCIAAEILGSCQNLFDMTIDYLKTRVQFDAPIGSFQALQHRAAWMFTELELARSCVLHAAQSLDEGKAGQIDADKVAKAVSLAMYKVSVMADKVTSEAVQLHGGIGVTDELDIGLLLKRIRVAQAILGDRAYHQNRYSHIVL
ncbi:acyl-CoA dehydrogenase [Thalassotalea ponticola]|uniref:acyl-CoA dehydrogenase family protein n=1 Tax=Thalassotalea ponticola TaxID=1523392 RepID=UPI0025B52D80|nr:acyl-CoA dehydrogenase [Thalassotalea ponticola]MDN3653455.1 acyl-CoA dehydrogenase [Thalassotalea ponticola]